MTQKARKTEQEPLRIRRTFPSNATAQAVLGPHNAHLSRLEQKLNLSIAARGSTLTLQGAEEAVSAASEVLSRLQERAERGLGIEMDDVDAALRFAAAGEEPSRPSSGSPGGSGTEVATRKKVIQARSPGQAAYLAQIDAEELVFGVGPAGTGKTYLAVAKGVQGLLTGLYDRIILTRPAVEAGEQLGFLPGDMREKVDPYLRPLYDALHDMLPKDQVEKRLESDEIEVAPLAFMRGRTLSNAFVILDEAQNTTAVQMKMFLTRLGQNSRMVVTGDLSQVDLPRGIRSGLRDALEILDGVKGVGITRFAKADVVRHPLVGRIVDAYDEADERRDTGGRYRSDAAPGSDGE
ncbi:MAG: PhoH family protein [Magnetovibrionaceae bacterium]